MADNTELPPGAGGDTIRDEDIGGIKFPVSKVALGIASVNDGDVAQTNPMPVMWPSTSLKQSRSASSAVAAGSSATFNSTQISSGKTGKLYYVKVASSVAFKASLFTVDTGVASAAIEDDYAFDGSWEWRSPHMNMVIQAEAGTSNFRVVVTNLDISLAADISVTFVWDEV